MTPLELVKSLHAQQKALNELTLAAMFLNKAIGDMLQHMRSGTGTDTVYEDIKMYGSGISCLLDGIELFERASAPMREMGEQDE